MNSASPLSVKNVSSRYSGQTQDAVKNISFDIEEGKVTGIIGPNGAGKSTVLKAALGLVPFTGEIKFWNQPLKTLQNKIAYIPQRKSIDWNFPVNALDVCLMGMYPQIGWFKRIKKTHKEEALSYLRQVEMQDLAERPIGALSGGQQQRVFVARALAQKADLFMFDEPMAGIDQKTQSILFDLFNTMKSKGKTILIVHHDLTTAAKQFDNIIMMNQSLIAHGKTADILTSSIIESAYMTETE